MEKKTNKILVTGSAGFIGFSLCLRLLEREVNVVGIDNHNEYYDPRIKASRLSKLQEYKNYTHHKIDISDKKNLDELFINNKPKIVANLAAQA